MQISISAIKPLGNFEQPLFLLRKMADDMILETTKYDYRFANLLELTLEFVHMLEEGIINKDIWNIDEAKQCFLYATLIAIDVNDRVQLLLNKIEPFEIKSSLTDYLETKKEIFPTFKIID